MIHSFTVTFGAQYLTGMAISVPPYETFSLIKNKDNALHKKSIEVYQKIATINNHIALTALGGCYEIGRGVEKNIDKFPISFCLFPLF
jgi:TPR repeat protein